MTKQKIGNKIALSNAILVIAIMSLMIFILSIMNSNNVIKNANNTVDNNNDIVSEFLKNQNTYLNDSINRFSDNFNNSITGNYRLETGDNGPELYLETVLLNNKFDRVDNFTSLTGAYVTVFAKDKNDFKRITTSIKDEQGKRPLGTYLGTNSPAYSSIMQGQPYIGTATLFGKPYITKYTPIFDAQRKLIATVFVGLDATGIFKSVADSINSFKIGRDGYFLVVSTNEENRGEIIAGGNMEGKNILRNIDKSGKAFVEEMLSKKEGVYVGDWNLKDNSANEQVTKFATFSDWNWLIMANLPKKESEEQLHSLLTILGAIGVGGAIILTFVGYMITNKLLVNPLKIIVEDSIKISNGDLTTNVAINRQDEVGELQKAMNNISSNLRDVISQVKDKAHIVEASSTEITQGNYQLSKRSEEQAAAVEETAAAMIQLEATIKHNADNSKGADLLTKETKTIVEQGNEAIQALIFTMDGIKTSSNQISEITSVIDMIAFQTNILALNAAVEAARAGEHGRGFAVVASEVRSLAKRCSDSAKEIKTLIEKSNGEVLNASDLVLQSGETMSQAVNKIQKVAEFINEISSASREQSDGVEQTTVAISQIEQGIQHNVAMVEEVASAADSLKAQSHELVNSISKFKI